MQRKKKKATSARSPKKTAKKSPAKKTTAKRGKKTAAKKTAKTRAKKRDEPMPPGYDELLAGLRAVIQSALDRGIVFPGPDDPDPWADDEE